MIIGGVVSLLTGLIMLIWPGKSLLVVAALFGCWLLVLGIVNVIKAFRASELSAFRRIFVGVAGLLYLVVGAVCLRNLFTSLTLLAVIIGLVWTVGGAAELAGGFPRVLPTITGLLSIAAGVAVFLWPRPTLLTIAVIGGVGLIVIGLVQIGYTLFTHRKRPPAPA